MAENLLKELIQQSFLPFSWPLAGHAYPNEYTLEGNLVKIKDTALHSENVSLNMLATFIVDRRNEEHCTVSFVYSCQCFTCIQDVGQPISAKDCEWFNLLRVKMMDDVWQCSYTGKVWKIKFAFTAAQSFQTRSSSWKMAWSGRLWELDLLYGVMLH